VQALDEQKLLDELGRLMALSGSAAGETAPAPRILRIGNCKLDLAGRSFVHDNGREVQLTRCLDDRCSALEHGRTAAVDFDVRLARRTPEGRALFGVHARLLALGG
jgi:hypothetical protein